MLEKYFTAEEIDKLGKMDLEIIKIELSKKQDRRITK